MPAIVFNIAGFLLLIGITSPSAASERNLYEETTWLRLSHYNKNYISSGYTSDILAQNFFLHVNGRTDPQLEFLTTLNRFKEAVKSPINNDNIICKYPARFLWFKSKRIIEHRIDPLMHCPDLRLWAKPQNLKSASIVLVTEHLGNPASSFGHLLLKIDNSPGANQTELLDQSINYGAVVPENENGFIYALFGLFGGYTASYTAKDVFEETHIYLNRELRDLWEYRLKLDNEQLRFLVAHLWEMIGQPFEYYFIHDNCALKMAQLLEIVFDKELITKSYHWQIPSKVIHRVNEEGLIHTEPQLIKSAERKVLDSFDQLDVNDQAIFKIIIQNPEVNILSSLSVERQINISNLLVLYYQYRIYHSDDDQSNFNELKNKWLFYRIKLPAETSSSILPTTIESPVLGHRPSKLSMGLDYFGSSQDQEYLNLAANSHDLLSYPAGSNPNSEFIALDLTLANRNNNLSLEKFIFTRLAKYKTPDQVVFLDSGLSWRGELGYDSENISIDYSGWYLIAGLGKTYGSAEGMYFVFLDTEIHEINHNYKTVQPLLNIGILYRFGDQFTFKIATKIWNDRHHDRIDQHVLSLRFSPDKNHEIRLSLNEDRIGRERNMTNINYNWYW